MRQRCVMSSILLNVVIGWVLWCAIEDQRNSTDTLFNTQGP